MYGLRIDMATNWFNQTWKDASTSFRNKHNEININTNYTPEERVRQLTFLKNRILEFLENVSNLNISDELLKKNKKLKIQIDNLYSAHKKIKIDLETAVRRDEILRTRKTDITPHRLFLIDKPVRKGIIPALYCFSILFISVGIFFLTLLQPTSPNGTNGMDVTKSLTPYLTTIYNYIIQYTITNLFIASIVVFLIVLILYLSIY